MMDDLTIWLLEQIAKDELDAKAFDGVDPDHYETPDLEVSPEYVTIYVSPKRIQAECDAKRQIVRLYQNAANAHSAGSISERNRIQDEAAVDVLGAAVQALVLPYADRPGCRKEWALSNGVQE